MSDELERCRGVALEALLEHFAADQLEPADFERRVDAARGAGSIEELRALLGDLPGRNLGSLGGAREELAG